MKIFLYSVLMILTLYLLLVYGFGAFLSSQKTLSNFLTSKTGKKVTTQGLKVETSPLMVYKIDTKSIQLESGIKLKNLEAVLDAKTLSLTLKGKDLPAADVEKVMLAIQKSKDSSKKFLENFTNYGGLVDVDVKITPNGTYGDCVFTNLSGNMVWFNIPVLFPKAVLHFEGRTLSSDADALLGGEKAHHKIYVTNFRTPHCKVNGEVTATLTEKFKYVPELTILNRAYARVTYNTKNKKNKVNYFLTIPPENDLKYKDMFLGMEDRARKFFFATFKDGNHLHWKNYTYSEYENGHFKTLLSGNGYFVKHGEKFKPSYIFGKTNGFIPISVVDSIGKYAQGGEFKGALRYDYSDKRFSGDLEARNTRVKDFFITGARAHAGEKIFVKGFGKFRGEDFTCEALAKNQTEGFYVYNMDVFLERFVIENQGEKSKSQNKNIRIENWSLLINRLQKDRLELDRVKLRGSYIEDILDFESEDVEFADGFLSASGQYDFNNDSKCIDVAARSINSNKVAGIFFGLADQIEGIIDASFRFSGKKVCAVFSMKDAALTKFGTEDFAIKNHRLAKILKLTNVDFNTKEPFRSDISGSFYLEDSRLKNIRLVSSQKSLSFLLDGEYDTKSSYADLNLYGNYNADAAKGIRVLFIPLRFILKLAIRAEHTFDLYEDKLAQIPVLEGRLRSQNFFRVKVKGDLKNKPEIEFKRIRQ